MKIGKIIAVCTSPNSGVPKYPHTSGLIGQYGLIGDYHCRPMRQSFSKPGTEKPNTDRHITIVAKEVVDELNHELGINVPIGGLGENILVEGLGDLSYINGGNVCIGIGPTTVGDNNIILRFVEQNQPCHNLAPYHPHYVKKIYGRRGLLCAVEGGIGKLIRPDDSITIYTDFGPI